MTRSQRILFNLSWLRPGEVGGTETYACRLLAALSQHCEGLELDALGTAMALEAVESRGAHISRRVVVAPSSRPGRVVRERTQLKAMGRRMDPDIVHHLGGTAPDFSGVASVVTIHDLQPLMQPQNFSVAKRAFLRRAIPRAVHRADAVISPSEYVADSIRDHFGLSADRVFSVPVYGAEYTPAEPSPVDAPFLLYPAMTMAHKNHAMLFDAFRQARRERPELQLVCTGTMGTAHASITQLADATPGVVMMGLVAPSVFSGLMQSAEAVVFPSLFEGFGLPIIEAQQAGTVVYASNATCLPEVMGFGGRLLDPSDADAWTVAMLSPLHGSQLEDEVARGRQNAARYSATRSAADQAQVYRAVLA